MKAGTTIRKRHSLLVRGVALFFLLFTGADLTMPEYFCGEGEIGGPAIKRTARVSTPAAGSTGETLLIAATAPDDSRPGQPSDQAPHEEDCFCCCAHVLPSLGFAAHGASEIRLFVAPLAPDSLPSPPLRGAYRPPRIA